MSKPTLRKGPASHYAAPNEIIREFGDGKGNGGLVSVRILDDGRIVVEVYSVTGPVIVHTPREATPAPDANSYVLVVRNPDHANHYTVDGDVVTVDVDLGSSFTGTPDDEETALDFAEGLRYQLEHVPTSTPVFRATVDTYRETLTNFPAALTVIDAYVAERLAD